MVQRRFRCTILYLKDSTYAYETLVACISENINDDGKGTDFRGLLSALNAAHFDGLNCASSMDDGQRYWLFLGNMAYVWDYSIRGSVSDPSKLSWFVCDNLNVVGSVIDGNNVYHLSNVNLGAENQSEQWIIRLDDTVQTDFGSAFRKIIQPKTQIFRTYQNLKNVRKAIFAFDSSRRMKNVSLWYITDYGLRQELRALDNLAENLIDSYPKPDAIRVREPKCLHVHHFAIRLESNDPSDLNLISIQIIYTYSRKTKAGLKM